MGSALRRILGKIVYLRSMQRATYSVPHNRTEGGACWAEWEFLPLQSDKRALCGQALKKRSKLFLQSMKREGFFFSSDEILLR